MNLLLQYLWLDITTKFKNFFNFNRQLLERVRMFVKMKFIERLYRVAIYDATVKWNEIVIAWFFSLAWILMKNDCHFKWPDSDS